MTKEWLVIYEGIDGKLEASVQKGKKRVIGWLKVIIDNSLAKKHIAVYPPGSWEEEVAKK